MTSKHFITLAALLKAEGVNRTVCESICVWCKQQNPAFDRQRFINACGFAP